MFPVDTSVRFWDLRVPQRVNRLDLGRRFTARVPVGGATVGDRAIRRLRTRHHSLVKGVSCGDTIAASPDRDGRLTFNKVLRRSGNSTLRVWLSAAAVDQCRQVRNAIERLGATSELNGTRFLSVDVPFNCLSAVWDYLAAGESRGDWEFEVGYLAET